MKRYGIILAAGQGTRMKSTLYKVLHSVCGKPMVGHIVDTVQQARLDRTIVVVGHGAEAVQQYLGDRVEYVIQAEQLGTGHAVIETSSLMENEEGVTLIAYGDTPLIRRETIERLFGIQAESNAAAVLLTTKFADPHGYGRIIHESAGEVSMIVEQKDCTPEQEEIQEINVGTYVFDNKKLYAALKKISNENKQKEYYLTDVIAIMKAEGESVRSYCTADNDESIGVNDRVLLASAEKALRQRINLEHMYNGVTIIDPDQTYIEADVTIGSDTTIHPGTFIRGNTVIGNHCVIGPQSEIVDSQLADHVIVRQSIVTESAVDEHSSIGPFAHIRPGTRLGREVKVGDFVELKNVVIHDRSKVAHLSYVGDAEVGSDVNIGCGAVTVNYDGERKHKTIIHDEAFIGSNVNLIAPVTIGKGAYVVAGSTITEDVPQDAMAIARERQTNKEDYVSKLREKRNNQHK